VHGRRGFPNIALVRDALGVLVPAMKKGRLPPPPAAVWDGHRGFPVENAVIAVQTLAKRIAQVYGLDIGTVVVTFLSNMQQAGRVELAGPGQRDFFIEIRDEYRTQPQVISAILGHEVAHIFLHKHQLHPPDGFAAEIMTDTTAALYGFGAAMADTFKVTETQQDLGHAIRITTHVHQLGYLTPDEMGYAVTRAGFGHVEGALQSPAARHAFGVGRNLAREELTSPPLLRSGWFSRLAYRLKRWWADLRKHEAPLDASHVYRLMAGKVMFRCTVCCQGIRLPTRARITATCPRCETELPCET
jgi:hypothetical protein